MSVKPVYITSDVHLGAVPRETERAFLSWLERAGAEASEIVINGDLFDFWFEYKDAIPRGHTRALAALADVVDSGVPITLMGGNHDWWGGAYLEEEIGISFHRDPLVRTLAERKTLIAHGDGLGRGDLGYRMLRMVLRGRFTVWAFRWLHPDFGAWLARRVSRTEAHNHARSVADGRAMLLMGWAEQQMKRDPDLDLVLVGHTHVPELREIGRDRWALNSGDWVIHRTYATLRPGEPPALLDWNS